jgi:tetratricopeptide (TPR) repeat protein
LTETLARAVHEAHQRGIVHRDLKPSNVLLTADGVPKVTDFGFAKSLDGGAGLTETGAVFGTPGYMAPEQAAGRAREAGAAADVFALGAILYNLLTGRPPFQGATPLEVIRRTETEEPTPPRRLQPGIPRDLEVICLKCLEKSPARRYASAADLAEDLRRFQAGEPIRARPVGALGRTWRLCRRNPVAATLAAAFTLALLAGTAVSLYFAVQAREQAGAALAQKEQAEDNAERARQNQKQAEDNARRAKQEEARAWSWFRSAREAMDETSGFVVETQLQGPRPLTDAQKKMVRWMLDYYDQFIDEPGEDGTTRLRVATAYWRRGDLRDLLGEKERAVDDYRRALTLLEKLTPEPANAAEHHQEMVRTLTNLALLLQKLGRLDEAEPLVRKALDAQEELAKGSTDPARRQDLARGHQNRAKLLRHLGRLDQAETHFRQALTVRRQLAKEFTPPVYRRELAATLTVLAGLLHQRDRRQQAESLYREALHLQEELARKPFARPGDWVEWADTLQLFAGLLAESPRPDLAAAPLRKAMEIWEVLAAELPNVETHRKDWAATMVALGVTLQRLGQPEKAEPLYQQALVVQKKLIEQFPHELAFRLDQADCLVKLGLVLKDLRQDERAEAAYRAAIGVREEVARRHADLAANRLELGGVYCNLGHLLRARHKAADALEYYDKALRTLEGIAGAGARQRATAQLYLRNTFGGRAAARAQLGRHAEALADWDRAIALVPAGPIRDFYRLKRCFTLLQLKDHVRATAQANELASLPDVNAFTLVDLARVCALSAAAARGKDQQVERYGARAVELLRQAVDKGYKDLPRLKNDPDFAALSQREDFQKLLSGAAKDPKGDKP